MFVALVGEVRPGGFARDHGEGRNGGQEERFQVVAADDDDGVGLELVELLAHQPHRRDVGIDLLGNFRRRAGEQLRCVYGGEGSNNLSHNFL